MSFGPGLLISGLFLGGYVYWRYSFRQVTSAIRLEQAGKFDDARTLLDGFLKNRNPIIRRGRSQEAALLLLARLDRKAGQYSDAIRHAKQLQQQSTSDSLTIVAMQVEADCLAWSGQLQESLCIVDRARTIASHALLTRTENDLNALCARVWAWQGDLPRSRALADRLSNGNGIPALYALLRTSEIECTAGNFDAAQQACTVLVDRSSIPGSDRSRLLPPATLWKSLARYHSLRSAWLSGDVVRCQELTTSPETNINLPLSDTVGWWGLCAVVAAESGQHNAAKTCLSQMEQAAALSGDGFGARAWKLYYTGRVQILKGDCVAGAELILQAAHSSPPASVLPEFYYSAGSALRESNPAAARAAYAEGAACPASFHFTHRCAAELGQAIKGSLNVMEG